jgi:hypothetical protein
MNCPSQYEKATVHALKEIVGRHGSKLEEFRDFMAVYRLLKMRLAVEHPGTTAVIDTLGAEGI